MENELWMASREKNREHDKTRGQEGYSSRNFNDFAVRGVAVGEQSNRRPQA